MKNPDKEKILLERVYKLIAESYFTTRNTSHYLREDCDMKFPRGLAQDVANYVQGKNPEYYNLIKKKLNN